MWESLQAESLAGAKALRPEPEWVKEARVAGPGGRGRW